MNRDERTLLQKAVDKGWLSKERFLELRLTTGEESGPWRAIPILLQTGELRLDQVESLAATPDRQNDADENPAEVLAAEAERYEIGEMLGSGGMSEVYKAYDRILQRHVALKKLKSKALGPQPRFLREARLQARIDHPNICQIYDIGCLDGEWYIAMTWINGQTLKQIGKDLHLEEKVRLVKESAEALHAAHRLGLVHRDVKPANIMVETSTEGWLKPYVTDFGLVREVERCEPTLTQDMVGSPLYMAPEQLTGDGANIDRRTDIFGLGVTLYELLSGRLPFQGDSVADVVVEILQKDPIPLRRIAPGTPRDLETIVMKSLEKDPEKRYGSARELAEDLSRFLEGVPIKARRYSQLQRAGRLLRKHKLLSTVIMSASILLLITAGLWLQARGRSHAQAEIAGRFGRDVERMESIMRFAYLVPPHDIRQDLVRVREVMAEIRLRMKELGKTALASGHYALGQGYLALRYYPEARRHLEIAWKNGARTPETAYALGVTLGELFQLEMRKTGRIQDADLRRGMEARLAAEYVSPALKMMAVAKPFGTVPARYIQAQIAFYQKNEPLALSLLEKLKEEAPQFYETDVLAGNVHQAVGYRHFQNGDTQSAFPEYEMALKAYDRAIQIGRSDPYLHLRKGELYEKIADYQFFTKQTNFEDVVSEGIACCNRALEIDPGLNLANLTKALIYITKATVLGQMGRDPTPFLQQGERVVKESLQVAPRDDYANYLAGKLKYAKVVFENHPGVQPQAMLQKAAGHYQQALATNPANVSARFELTRTLMYTGFLFFWQGNNPEPVLNRAIEAYRPIREGFPGFAQGYSVLGSTLFFKFLFAFYRGTESWSVLDEAVNCYRTVVRLYPETPGYHFMFGWVLLQKAQCLAQLGKETGHLLAESLNLNKKALQLDPHYINAFIGLGAVRSEQAAVKLQHGLDPRPELTEADAWLEKAFIARSPNFEMYSPLLANEWIRAKRAYWTGRPVAPHVKRARKFFIKTRVQNPEYHDPFDRYAMILHIQARQHLQHNGSPLAALQEAREVLETVSGLKPDFCLHHLLLGETELLRARFQMSRGNDPEHSFGEAAKEIEQSIQINSRHAPSFIARAEWCLWNSRWQKERPEARSAVLEQGLTAVEQALELDPVQAESWVLKGLLLQEKTLLTMDRAERDRLKALMGKCFQQAFSINPLCKEQI